MSSITEATLPQTIDEVIIALENLIEECITQKDRLGYFAALYHQITVKIKEGIANNEFDDGGRMERMDVIFASRYLASVAAFRQKRDISASWLVAFNGTHKWNALVLQHLLAAMNAHINYDLGVAAVETIGNGNILDIRKDFNQINSVIGLMLYEVLNELNRVSPLLSLFGLHASNNSILIQFSINNARDGAWSFAEDLNGRRTEADKNATLISRDNTIEKLGVSLLQPKGLLAFTKWIILLFEWKNPSRIIRAFYKYKRQYISVNDQ